MHVISANVLTTPRPAQQKQMVLSPPLPDTVYRCCQGKVSEDVSPAVSSDHLHWMRQHA